MREYIVRAVEPDAVFWFILRQGRLVELPPDAVGIYRSEVFPGLWLDPAGLLAGDIPKLQAIVNLGCVTQDHAAFVARLTAARAKT